MLFSTLSVVRVKTYLLLSPSQTEEGQGRRGDEGRGTCRIHLRKTQKTGTRCLLRQQDYMFAENMAVESTLINSCSCILKKDWIIL